ncbi:glycosyltransferase family 2 protein [Luteibacter pinisoli]|uniref:Glycosyltransferase family 2 protein n=1 Tax=Luteibacter pinisoli TaxID=2589080 RepID=A0A4Y5YYP2_9GAMM|nr:glycosyltransferase family 2 protein [Luteibacter pinisoli]QDE37977.1 glycosyltransferase family 2 protein [Luteibacter pinisoli]
MNAAGGRYCVLIPCLNEAQAIARVVGEALALGMPVIVVDDGSDDPTPDIVGAMPVTLLRHATRRGKGEALRTGFREAMRLGYDGVFTMDGDGQHLAGDIPAMLEASRQHPGAIVIGARLLEREQQPPGRRRANAVADWGISWACGRPIADTQSGQRFYPRAALDLVDVPAENFVFEAAVLITACRERGVGVVSVPIASRYQGEFRISHFSPVRDVTRITTYTIGRLLHYGHIVSSYRRSRATPTIIADATNATTTH